jgi:PAS domain S-box-containing protein
MNEQHTITDKNDILDFAPDALFQINEHRRIIHVNEKSAELTGYGREELLTMSFSDLFSQNELLDKPLRFDLLDQALTVMSSRKLLRKDGRLVDVQMNSRKLPEGTYISFIRDISEKIKSEEALRLSEDRFLHLVEKSPDILYSYSTKKGRSFHSEQVIRILGYTPEQLQEDPTLWYNCIHHDDQPMVDSELAQALKGKPIDIEYRIFTAEGEWKWIHDRSLQIFIYDDETIIEGIAMDITRRKNIENQLMITTQTYLDIFNSLTEAIYVLDEAGQFIDVNRGAEVMYELSRDELIGQTLQSVAVPGMNDLDFIQQKMKEVFQSNNTATFEFWGKRKKGKHFPKEVIVNKGYYFGQEVLIATARDISERKYIEDALKINEEKYRRITENMTDVLFTTDMKLGLNYLSPSVMNIFGKPSEILMNYPLKELFQQHVCENIQSYIDSQQEKNFSLTKKAVRPLNIDSEIQKSDGTRVQISINLSFILDEAKEVVGLMGVVKDITQIKKAELKLEKSEERFRELVTLLPVAVFETNADFILTFANARAHEMFGYNERDFRKGFNCLNILSPPDMERAIRMMNEQEKRKKIESFEFQAIRKNGSNFPILLYFSEIIQESTVAGYRGIIIDLSEAKKAEESEILLKEQLKQILNLVPSYIFAKDYDGKFLMVNKSLADLFGATPEEVIGKTDADYGATPLQIEWYQKNDREVMDSGKEMFVIEEQVLRKDGTTGWFQTNKIPYRHPGHNKPAILGIAVDITERKKAEEQLRESEEKFKSLALLSPFAIMIFQGEKWVYTNPAGEFITGFSAEELQQMNYWDFVSEDFKEIIKDRGQKRQAGEAVSKSFEMKICTKSGEEKWIFLNATLIEYLGQPAGLVAFADISYRKIIEDDLLSAKEKAEESDRLKSAFLANMSHEIRTPMNGILGFLDLLKEIDLSTEEKNMYIEVVRESGQRLMNTINDIIEMSKIESKQIELHTSDVNIERELKFYYDFFKSQAEKKNIELVCKQYVTGNNAILECDKSKLHGILTNLINNAIKFTDEGSIEFGSMIEDDKVLFFVRDTGMGIPVSRQQAIFERFVHADISLTKPKEGTGLGLSISKAYVELLGGEIWVISKEGYGSTFYFTIPYKPVQISHEIPEQITGSYVIADHDLKVLIAEDDEISYKFIECILEKENIQLIHTLNGEETVSTVRNNPAISLVLMDIRMPVMNGIDATKLIREFNVDIPIIAQTAYALDGDRELLLKAGCNDYIAKPIKKDKLMALLKKYALKH